MDMIVALGVGIVVALATIIIVRGVFDAAAVWRVEAPFRITEAAIDAAGLGGAGLITYGVSRIYEPAAFIVGGVFLLVTAWLVARKAG